MLYGLGLILLLVSTAFVGGSAAIPLVMAVTGIVLMKVGRRPNDDKEETGF